MACFNPNNVIKKAAKPVQFVNVETDPCVIDIGAEPLFINNFADFQALFTGVTTNTLTLVAGLLTTTVNGVAASVNLFGNPVLDLFGIATGDHFLPQ